MQSDGGLNQALVEEAERTASWPPQVLPGFVGLEVTPRIEKNYSVPQKIAHSAVPSKLLIKWVQAAKMTARQTLNNTWFTGLPQQVS